MIITPKRPRNSKTGSRLSRLVPYMLKSKGGERCTWYMAGNLDGLDRREDAELALSVMELVQDGNVRAKGDKTYHVVISFHPNDRRLSDAELTEIVSKSGGDRRSGRASRFRRWIPSLPDPNGFCNWCTHQTD